MFVSPLIARIGFNSIRSLSNFRCSKQLHMARPPILALALPSDTGRVLSIQSHTVQGYVGNKSAVFPLQLLGYEVDPINSVQFSNHTGYIGSVSFLNTVLKVVDKLRSVNPKLTYVCDPVMGDEGKLYVPPELVAVYREKVVPVASMLTPNQFEAEQLTGSSITSEKDGQEACIILHAAGPSKVVITSINIDGTLLLIGSHQKEKGQSPEQFKIVIPKIPAYFTGTGDLMTALLLGWSNKYPNHLDKAAELAVSSVQALLLRTLADYQKAGYDCQSSSLEIRWQVCAWHGKNDLRGSNYHDLLRSSNRGTGIHLAETLQPKENDNNILKGSFLQVVEVEMIYQTSFEGRSCMVFISAHIGKWLEGFLVFVRLPACADQPNCNRLSYPAHSSIVILCSSFKH
ncbi:hypothetical protein K7X08_019633 [Anisodus acutangulus]|uniref:pyridoxal kinase n=1 Tax=Anisodus acutangulus TaxID=402998 RepID=A0A9Q1MRW3_9SOLA|nr:hypothetical protein K7X08_019633 [Anisodus acutangulus]